MGDVIDFNEPLKRSRLPELVFESQGPNPADIQYIEKKIEELGRRRLPYELRLQLARNLGHLLLPLRKERGALSQLLEQCCGSDQKADSTKFLSRYVAFPGDKEPSAGGKGFHARIGRYQELASEGAVAVYPELKPEDAKRIGIAKLVEQTDLAPSTAVDDGLSAEARDAADRLSDLVQMLTAIASSVISTYDLNGYHKRIASWALRSGNGGANIYVYDHVADAGPEDQMYWSDRTDLFPLVKLFTIPMEGDASISISVEDENEQVRQDTLYPSRGIWFGVAPLGPNGRTIAVLADRLTWLLSENDSLDAGIHSLGVTEEYEGHWQDSFVWADGYGKPARIKINAEAGLPINALPAWFNLLDRVEPLTRYSAFRFFHVLPPKDQLLESREAISADFWDATRAVPHSVAASIERNLRYQSADDPHRIDNRLRAICESKTGALERCLTEIDAELRRSTARFLDEQTPSEANKPSPV